MLSLYLPNLILLFIYPCVTAIIHTTKYNINKCGPILLSEALEVIQTHCNTYYKANCVIQIYIIACLEEEDLLILVSSFMGPLLNVTT